MRIIYYIISYMYMYMGKWAPRCGRTKWLYMYMYLLIAFPAYSSRFSPRRWARRRTRVPSHPN